jgi:hypothetical protein
MTLLFSTTQADFDKVRTLTTLFGLPGLQLDDDTFVSISMSRLIDRVDDARTTLSFSRLTTSILTTYPFGTPDV